MNAARWTPFLVLFFLTLLIGLTLVWGNLGVAQESQMLRAIALREGRSPEWLIEAFQWITWSGDAAQRSLVMIAFSAALLWKKRWRAGLIMLVFPAVAGATSSILKQAFARARPDVVPHLDTFGNLSFPSGHATSAMAILLLAALLIPRHNRAFWIGLAVLGGSLVSVSRLFLGVHWPSDIVSGMMWGTGFALAGATAAKRWGDRAR